MKKAFLVEYNIKTRVVVDVPNTADLSTSDEERVIAAAKAKILSDATNYIIPDNACDVMEDVEMPYDPKFDNQ